MCWVDDVVGKMVWLGVAGGLSKVVQEACSVFTPSKSNE